MSANQTSKAYYKICIEGHLGSMWMPWFEGMEIRLEASEGGARSITILSGPVPDQPALYGLLTRIRDLNLTLMSVEKIR